MKTRLIQTLSTLMAAVAALLPIGAASAATHTWTGAAGDGRWSTAFNWSGGAPAPGEAASVVLVFPAAGTKNTTNDIGGLTLDQIQVSGDNYVIAATGVGTNVTIRSQIFGSAFFLSGANPVFTNFTFTLATNVTSQAGVSVSTGDTATFRCRFVGPGGLSKIANGTLVLDGNAPNTYAGLTTVNGGLLQLSHSSNAIPGDVVVGNPLISNLAELELLFQNQIADGAKIIVNSNGTFTPGVFSEAITSLTLSNANQVAGPGLTLLHSLTSVGTNTLTGTILLGGDNRIFDVTGYLTASCFINNNSGAAGIVKNGPGVMELQRTNNYNATTVVNEGTLLIAHAGALGNAAIGTQVNPGATLQIKPGLTLPPEALFLNGFGVASNGALVLSSNTTLVGAIQLSSDAAITVNGSNALAVLSSQITGGGALHKFGIGSLQLAGGLVNTFAGGVNVREGAVELNKPAGINAVVGPITVGREIPEWQTTKLVLMQGHQIADTVPLYIDASGLFDLGGLNEKVGQITLRRGTIKTGAGTLTLGDNVMVHRPRNLGVYTNEIASIYGNVSLGGADRMFIFDEGDLRIYGSISDGGAPAGLIKAGGASSMKLFYGPNTYSGITRVMDGDLWLRDGATPGSASGGTVIHSYGRILLTSTTVGDEALTFDGPYVAAQLTAAGTGSWAGPITLAHDADISLYNAADDLTLSGVISGPGKLIKRYGGKLKLAGSGDNILTGEIFVEEGTLELNKSGGAVAVPAGLTIGTTNLGGNALVRLLGNNQIDNSTVPTVNANGKLDLNGFSDAVGGLNLFGGDVSTGSGMLTLLGDVKTKNPIDGWFIPSSVYGNVSLGGAVRTFHVGVDGYPHTFNVGATLSDGGAPAGFKLVGPSNYGGSYVVLQLSNSFSGPVTVCSGKVLAYNSAAFGSTAGGTVVSNGASIELGNNVQVLGEPLFVEGYGVYDEGAIQCRQNTTNRWSGPINLGATTALISVWPDGFGGTYFTNATLILDGPIAGPAGLKIDAMGKVIISGSQSNNYAGVTTVVRGDVKLAKTNATAIPRDLVIRSEAVSRVTLERDNQIGDGANIYIAASAELNLSNRVDTIEALRGTGKAAIGSGTLRLVGSTNASAANYTFDGSVTGTGIGTNLMLLGGRQVFAGTNSVMGQTVIAGGTLFINGLHTNAPIIVSTNGTLAGKGRVADVTVNGGGCVAPGSVDSIFGRLAAGTVVFNAGSKFKVDLGGTVAGTNCDQLMSSGMLIINNASLDIASATALSVGDTLAIIDVTSGSAAFGNFTGLPSGTTFNSPAGLMFAIAYTGGADAKDVVLTTVALPAPSQLGGIAPLPNGSVQLSGQGAPLQSYSVFANTNLATTNWVFIGSVASDAVGRIVFIDQQATNFPMRFYRFVMP